jgi:hypothetical protein
MPEVDETEDDVKDDVVIEKKDEGADNVNTDDAKDDAKDSDEDSSDEDSDDEEPIIEVRKRKSPQDFIIERQKRKIEKLKKEKEADDDSNDEEEDDDIDPEDERVVSKIVAKHMAPILEEKARNEDVAEIDKFISDNPEFSKYKKKVAVMSEHPSRASVPIKDLFFAVAGNDLMKIGADRAKKAADNADRGNSGGGSPRGDGEERGTDYSAMSSEEFEKKKEEIRQKQRD